MNNIYRITGLAALFFTLLACQQKQAYQTSGKEGIQHYKSAHTYPVNSVQASTQPEVKNVILMIGDGMSLMHMYTAWTVNKGKLNIENCQFTGLSKTHCSDTIITDSAAGGTAMASGQKTKKGRVGTDAEGKPLKNICEYASEAGLSTGIVATCRLVDATPACFSVKNTDRNNEEAIAAAYLNCNIDFILGGGLQYFTQRKDSINLLPQFEQKGYQVITDMQGLGNITGEKVFAPIAKKDMAKPMERKDQLWQSTQKALDFLCQDEDGFFLMVEGSMIDDYGHFNELPTLMEEILDFDRTVGKVFEWAAQNPGTLVIVTADHETGGLTLVGGDIDKGEVASRFSTSGHSGVMVPVYTFGAGAQHFSGIYDNTAIFEKIKTQLKL